MRLLLAIFCCVGAIQDKPVLPPEPDANAQKDTLKSIKDLFKDDYAKKGAADQSAFAQKLLQKGVETNDDATSKFVLLKEARDVAAAAGDSDTAFRAAHEMGKAFAVDAPALKLAVVTKMAATTREPEAARSLAKNCIALIAEAIRAESFESAVSLQAKAEGLARLSQDATLAVRLQDLKKEVASLRDEYTRVKPMLEKPGSGDEEAVGRYLCFVKGDWDAGLAHLVAGAKAPLKALVEKDALHPAEADKQVELADGWADLAQKERSAWRKSRIQARVRFWLEKAQPGATGVLKMRIEKKLGELEEAEPGVVNLLKLIDVRQDAILGDWTMDGGTLISPSAEWVRIQIPYTPPEEYDLMVVAERKDGIDSISFGLGQGRNLFALWVDGHPDMGGKTGIDQLDNTTVEKSPVTVTGQFVTNNKPSTFIIAVRKNGLTLTIDGKVVLSWQGSTNRLSQAPMWRAKDPKAPLFVGAYGSRYHYTKIQLTPVTGQGKKLR